MELHSKTHILLIFFYKNKLNEMVVKKRQCIVNCTKHVVDERWYGAVTKALVPAYPHRHPIQQARLHQVLESVVEENNLYGLVGHRLHNLVVHCDVYLVINYK